MDGGTTGLPSIVFLVTIFTKNPLASNRHFPKFTKRVPPDPPHATTRKKPPNFSIIPDKPEKSQIIPHPFFAKEAFAPSHQSGNIFFPMIIDSELTTVPAFFSC
jgi:hypothetical protein